MTEKWKCTVCGYIDVGEGSPDRCPVCKAESGKFVVMPSPDENIKVAENVVVTEKKECQLISFEEHVNAETSVKAGEYEIQPMSLEAGERIAGYSFEKEALVIVMSGSAEVLTCGGVEVAKLGSEEVEEGDQTELELSEIESSDEEGKEDEEVEDTGGMALKEHDVVVVPGGEMVDFVNVGEGVLVLLVVL